MKETTYMYL